MNETQFKNRTKAFALRIIQLTDAMPRHRSADVIGRQLLRSETSVGANYRSACRGRSPAECASKLSIAEEETDETLYWIELIIESGRIPRRRLTALKDECNEILSMLVASIRTIRKSQRAERNNPKSNIQN